MAAASTRVRLIVGIGLAIALDTAVQLCWKLAAAGIPETSAPRALAEAILAQPLFAAVGVLLLCQLFNWLAVLNHADLSFAKPITSLSKVTVCVLSVLYLGESMNRLKVIGIAVVIIGIWCICQTPHSTTKDQAARP